MRIRPSEATLSAARQSRISPTVTFAPVRSRNVSDTSPRCHDSLATCAATAFTELDKIIASRKPRCSAMRRIRSSSEMPHRSVSASGESATINNGGRKGSVILRVAGVFRQFVSSQTRLARMFRYASWHHADPDFAALPHPKNRVPPQGIARCNRDKFPAYLEGKRDHRRQPLPVYFCGQPPTLPEQPEEKRDHGKGEKNVQNP